MLIKVRNAATEKDNYINPDSVDLIAPCHGRFGFWDVYAGNEVLVVDNQNLQIIATASEREDENWNLMTVRLQKDNGKWDARFHEAVRAFWKVMQGETPAEPTPPQETFIPVDVDETIIARELQPDEPGYEQGFSAHSPED